MPKSLNAKQIRASKAHLASKQQQTIKRNPVVLVLDNVLDTYNIGSFFRLADAIAAQKIYLCGPVITPPNIKIHRASIGTWKWLDWQHMDSTQDCIKKLQKEGYKIVSCELSDKSVLYNTIDYPSPLAIVAGNETTGVTPEVLKLSDLVVKIPMHGINISLNTLIATSIISYQALSQLKKP